MSDQPHVLIAYASSLAEGCAQTLPGLALPQLHQLLARLAPCPPDLGDELDYAAPHERALARALGLPAPATPWAAWESAHTGQPCAWITPCHWQVGADQIHMHPVAALGLQAEESQALLALIAPWLEQDGITLQYHSPERWLASGAHLTDLECATLEQAQGRDVRHWLPRGPQERLWQRLHSELQMLLYNHPFNDARTARGLPPINAFWLHGAGSLAQLPPARPHVTQELRLRTHALQEDWSAWTAAWRTIDTEVLAPLARQAASGQAVQLTLCGERHARSWRSAPRSLGQKIHSLLRPQRLIHLREQL